MKWKKAVSRDRSFPLHRSFTPGHLPGDPGGHGVAFSASLLFNAHVPVEPMARVCAAGYDDLSPDSDDDSPRLTKDPPSAVSIFVAFLAARRNIEAAVSFYFHSSKTSSSCEFYSHCFSMLVNLFRGFLTARRNSCSSCEIKTRSSSSCRAASFYSHRCYKLRGVVRMKLTAAQT